MAKKSSILADELSPLQKNLVDAFKNSREEKVHTKPTLNFVEAAGVQKLGKAEIAAYDKKMAQSSPLVKSVMDLLNGGADSQSVERLAFETDPGKTNVYHSIYRYKLWLLPNEILKRLSIQDDLVAAISIARSNQISSFGRPQPSRFDTGYKIEPVPGILDDMGDDDKKKLQAKIADVEKRLLTCGKRGGYDSYDLMKDLNFSQALFELARSAVIFGQIAVELVHDRAGNFHSFRPMDAGTMYRAAPMRESAEAVRADAMIALTRLRTEGTALINPDRFLNDDYTWVQVINGYPRQVFTDREVAVHNFYPTTDVELDGYPLTPLDTVIAAVTMHINITNHNKLYFQSGRAARGILVVKSDAVDTAMIKEIRQHFQASINSVSNSWRTPLFGVGSEDEVTWLSIDATGRDMEFQFLSETNARVILSAFQMSPEELPGYSHLSRGSNTQALSESSNEYRLEAHRDTGIRPLLAQFQNFFNQKILPLMDKEVAEKCAIKFIGLDVDTAEKEAVRLQQDLAIHMTIDEVLERVQKKPLGPEKGGSILLNPQYHQFVLDKYLTVGQIMEFFFGITGASKDPNFAYIRDQFWFTQQQMIQQQQAMAQQQQMAAMGMAPEGGGEGGGDEGGGDGGGEGGGGGPPQGGGDDGGGGAPPSGPPPAGGGDDSKPEDLSRSLDQLGKLITKSEEGLPESRKRSLAQQRAFVRHAMEGFEETARESLKDILEVVSHHVPAKKKK
jgi:hypothetical protein